MNETTASDSVKLLPDFLVSVDSVLESEDLFLLLQKLGISLLIGLLIGLEGNTQNQKMKKFLLV